jgi:hypothetical protein
VVKSPAFATGVGLVKYGASKLQEFPVRHPATIVQRRGLGSRIGSWIREVF